MQQPVTFIQINSIHQCRETGDSYEVSQVKLDRLGYAVFRNSELATIQPSRAEAFAFIEQDARLAFATAQADCGAWTDCDIPADIIHIELDCR